MSKGGFRVLQAIELPRAVAPPCQGGLAPAEVRWPPERASRLDRRARATPRRRLDDEAPSPANPLEEAAQPPGVLGVRSIGRPHRGRQSWGGVAVTFPVDLYLAKWLRHDGRVEGPSRGRSQAVLLPVVEPGPDWDGSRLNEETALDALLVKRNS